MLRSGEPGALATAGDALGKASGDAGGEDPCWSGLFPPPPITEEIPATGRGEAWLAVLGRACTFFTPWKGRMAGMECVPTCLPLAIS